MASQLMRLWAQYARMDIVWLLKDTRTFVVATTTEILTNLASVTGIWLLAERFLGIGGMRRVDVIFMLGYSLTVGGLTYMLFGYNTLHISRRIGRGQMDHVLLQPQPVWVTLLTEGFLPASSSNMFIAGVGVLTWAVGRLDRDITPAWLLLVLVSLALSATVSLAYSFLWGSLAFVAPVAGEEVCTSVVDLFTDLRNFPLGGLTTGWRHIMTSAIPVGLCAWYPSVSLLSRDPTPGIGFLAAMAVIYTTVTAVVFRKGLGYYVTRGSYRYFDRGHRR